jgi:hypothetical protein
VTDYFAEKAQQVEPSGMGAFGVTISSRYGKADELIELMRFSEHLAGRKVAHYVKSAFYDSKAYICTIELDPSVHEGDAVAAAIYEAASETIGQFDWFGTGGHGRSNQESYVTA